ncbi:MAG: hypothetical protein AB1715_11000 [Acidobacteriota bacterium]
MKPREVILLLLIIAAGVLFFHIRTGKIDFEWDEYVNFDWDEFTYEESQVIEPPFPSALKIINAHGQVEIQGAETDKITFTLEKKIWRRTEEKAREVADKLHPFVRRDEDRVILTTNREEFRKRNFETSFRLSVPSGLNVEVSNSYGMVKANKVAAADISNRHGRVEASEVNGELLVENSYEEVKLEDIFSRCTVTSRHADISVKRAFGDLEIKGSYGLIVIQSANQKVVIAAPHTEIEGTDLAGPLEISNSYEEITLHRVGPTKIEGLHSPIEATEVNGSLEISDTYETVRLTSVKGNLRLSGKNAQVIGSDIRGEDIYISSSYEDIELAGFDGKTTILNSHGKVTLTPLALTGPIEVRCTSAPIFFFWPQGGPYPLEAQTKHADIDWRLEGEMEVEEKDGLTTAKIFSGLTGKPGIRLSTTYGDILIDKAPLQ